MRGRGLGFSRSAALAMRRWARVGGLKEESKTYNVSDSAEWSGGIVVRTSKSFDEARNRFSREAYWVRRAWNEDIVN